MKNAIEEAKKVTIDIPVGVVIKKDDKITIRGIGFVNSMTFGTRESIIVN